MSIGQELLNVPMGAMIHQMAFAIAESQLRLDASSIEAAEMMGGLKSVYDAQGEMTFEDSRVFFGYDLMTVEQADAYLKIEQGLRTWDTAPLENMLKAEKNREGVSKPTDLVRVPTRLSMLELGFTPTFYQFVDTIIEVKIAIKITRSFEYTQSTKRANQSTSSQRSGSAAVGFGLFSGVSVGSKSANATQVSTSQVDASYTQKYGYSAEGSSLLRTKLVPLPPPPILEERIRRQMDEDTERRQKLLDAALSKGNPSPA